VKYKNTNRQIRIKSNADEIKGMKLKKIKYFLKLKGLTNIERGEMGFFWLSLPKKSDK